MSRNLASTRCRICEAAGEGIVLEEPPRPITAEETGSHMAPNYVGSLVVANAHCVRCDAKYLAWVSHRFLASPGSYGRWDREPHEGGLPFVDLSFRSSFNDEPGAEDLPSPEKLRELHQAKYLKEARRLMINAHQLLSEADDAFNTAYSCEPYWESYRRSYR